MLNNVPAAFYGAHRDPSIRSKFDNFRESLVVTDISKGGVLGLALGRLRACDICGASQFYMNCLVESHKLINTAKWWWACSLQHTPVAEANQARKNPAGKHMESSHSRLQEHWW
jgi:hypothetical protein